MRTIAKVALLIFIPAIYLSQTLLALVLWPIVVLSALPLAWYVLFTLPEERAQEFETLRALATAHAPKS